MKKRVFCIIICMVSIIAYVFSVSYISFFLPFDSDKANHMLQAWDILHGNLFFRDWNLTGITFYTTDLLFYMLGELFSGGIGLEAAHITYSLMISSCMILTFCAIIYRSKKYTVSKIVLFSLLFAIPCRYLMQCLRVHSGALCWSFIAILLAVDLLSRNSCIVASKFFFIKLFLFYISLTLGTFGDMLTVIEATIPILLYCTITILNSDKKYYYKTDIRSYLIVISLLATISSVMLDKIYFFIGEANKNSYIGDMHFSTVDEWHSKLWDGLSNLLLMGDAGFIDGKLNDIWNYTRVINGGIIVISLILIGKNIWCLLRDRDADVLSMILSVSFVTVFSAIIFTDKHSDIYMTMTPLICFIVLLRNVEDIISFMKSRVLWISLIYSMSALSFVGKMESITLYHIPESIADILLCSPEESKSEMLELATLLKEHDLHYGYASFWNASVFTIISEQDINVRHIKCDSRDRFIMYNWFNKNQWYCEDTNFVIVDNKKHDEGASDKFGVSVENVKRIFGEPSETYECNNYIVMIYDHSISPYLVGIEDGKIIPYEMYHKNSVTEEGEGINSILLLDNGGIVYGPYIRIDPGVYTLKMVGQNLDSATCDVWSNGEKKKEEDYDYRTVNNLDYEIVEQTKNEIIINVEVKKKKIDDIEFRLRNNTDQIVELDEILINKGEFVE